MGPRDSTEDFYFGYVGMYGVWRVRSKPGYVRV